MYRPGYVGPRRLTALLLTIFLTIGAFSAQGQENKQIDASKPTNLYTQLDNAVEFARTANGNNLYGYRASVQLASANQHHLAFVEVPLLYNEKTTRFGLSDVRVRYFGITHKDYSKKFGGVWGGSVDIFAPTGSFDGGLGSNRWTIAPGIVTGLILSPKFQSFPIISYQFLSRPTSDKIPDSQKETLNGMTFQAITVINFEKWFAWVTPIYVIPDLGNGSRKNRFILQVAPSMQAIGGKYRPSAFFRYDFQNKSYQARIKLVVYI